MKKITAVAAAALVMALAGCASGSEQERSTETLRQESIVLEDGRTVECVIYASYNNGGLSCDWESAR